MKNVFIFHGTGGYPGENWFPSLKGELEKRGYQVTVPQFPTPEGQSLAAWNQVLSPDAQKITEDTVLIGHSLGGLFLLRLLESLDHSVRASFFIAASAGVKPIKFYQGDYDFSPGFDFDWDKIRSNSGHAEVFHSDTDPFISLGNGQKIADELGVELSFIPNAGHFNQGAGYTQFPGLLERIIALDK